MYIDEQLLSGIKPKIKGESDKYSWNLYKWMKRWLKEHPKTIKMKVYYLPKDENDKYDRLSFRNEQILIGERWRDDCIAGMTVRTIVATDRGFPTGAFMCNFNVHIAQDITEEFMNDYFEFGRCFLFNHGSWLRNRENQFEIRDNGNERLCHWCGRVERKRIEVETKIIEREIWE